ncbi:MAG: 4Fe-4S binding protein, partial [Chitinophagales bacterium]
MSIKTGRAEGVAQVSIDYDKCNACGLCVEVCYGKPLYIEDKKVKIDQSHWFGCIACGQCMAVCPRSCIFVNGRCLSPEDVLPIPPREQRASYDQLYSLMLSRRSVRDFKKEEVEQEKIDQILAAASTSPMGLPPSDVGVIVFKGRDKVQELAGDIINVFKKYWWM